jgi:hypothetical protein
MKDYENAKHCYVKDASICEMEKDYEGLMTTFRSLGSVM